MMAKIVFCSPYHTVATNANASIRSSGFLKRTESQFGHSSSVLVVKRLWYGSSAIFFSIITQHEQEYCKT